MILAAVLMPQSRFEIIVERLRKLGRVQRTGIIGPRCVYDLTELARTTPLEDTVTTVSKDGFHKDSLVSCPNCGSGHRDGCHVCGGVGTIRYYQAEVFMKDIWPKSGCKCGACNDLRKAGVCRPFSRKEDAELRNDKEIPRWRNFRSA